jgi:hypothetical protein
VTRAPARSVLAAMATALALLPVSVATAGCESTRAQAEKLTQEGGKAFTARGVRIGARNRDVQLVQRAVVHDANGTAAIVVLRNRGARALEDVPIALAVKDARGKVLWRNDAPGLEPGLTHVALLAPGQTVTWVNDQVLIPSPPAHSPTLSLAAKVGAGQPAPPTAARLAIDVEGAALEGDPASGETAVAKAVNGSDVEQRDLVIAVVARRRGDLVAAGRALVPSLKANGRARFQAFFIGDPRGAELSFDAQPSTLGGAR